MAKYLPEFCLSILEVLNCTNISEKSFGEIVEMIIKDKAVAKLEKDTKEKLDST